MTRKRHKKKHNKTKLKKEKVTNDNKTKKYREKNTQNYRNKQNKQGEQGIISVPQHFPSPHSGRVRVFEQQGGLASGAYGDYWGV